MKILHVVVGLHKAGGGTSEIVPRMCEELVRQGHEVRIVTGDFGRMSESAERAQQRGVDICACRARRIFGLGFLRLTSEFKHAIRDGVKWCEIVHVHGLWQDPCWYAPFEARRQGKPYVMETHGFVEPERLKKSGLQKWIIGAVFERRNLNRAMAVIATAESERLGIRQYGVNVPVEVVPLGLDASLINGASRNEKLLARLGLDPAKKTLLYFSRLTPIKGLDMLADAWSSLTSLHSSWQVCIAGPDDRGYAAEIKKYFESKIRDGSVVFPGPVYGDDKYTLLNSVDAFVLPTRSENFSIAVQEALAAGLPTVCTKGAPWEAIAEDGAGEWVDVSVEGILKGLTIVLTADTLQREKMARAGRHIVNRDYAWDAVTTKLVAVYDKCIAAFKCFDR